MPYQKYRQKNTRALFDNWRQLHRRIGKEVYKIESAADLEEKLLTPRHPIVMDKTNPCRVIATDLFFRPDFWHTLALVRHIPLLIEDFLLPYKYTQSRLKSKLHIKDAE